MEMTNQLQEAEKMQAMPLLRESAAQIEEVFGTALDEITVERAVFGLFFSGVKLSTGHGGLCFTPVKEMPEAVCCPSSAKAMPLSGKLRGRPVRAYLDDIFCGNVLRRTLGIAALNALSMAVWDSQKNAKVQNNQTEAALAAKEQKEQDKAAAFAAAEQGRPEKAAGSSASSCGTYEIYREIVHGAYSYEILHNADAFDYIDVSKYKKSAVVGALVPILKKLIAAGADFHVLEQDPRTLKEREMPYYLPADRAADCVPSADLLVITGVTILNDTLPGLLRMAKPGAEILVTGPTASMLPDAFFRRGVTMLGGIQVTKPDELLDIISEGGSGYHFFGKYAERTLIRKISG